MSQCTKEMTGDSVAGADNESGRITHVTSDGEEKSIGLAAVETGKWLAYRQPVVPHSSFGPATDRNGLQIFYVGKEVLSRVRAIADDSALPFGRRLDRMQRMFPDWRLNI